MPDQEKQEPIKLSVVRTPTCAFISKEPLVPPRYSYTNQLMKFVYDGGDLQPQHSYVDNWIRLDQIPTKIEKIIPGKNINVRYELREGFTPSEKLPSVVTKEDFFDDDYDPLYPESAYERKCDQTPETKEEIQFEIDVIAEVDNENHLTGFEMPASEDRPSGCIDTNKRPIVESDIQHPLIDRLTFAPFLLPTRPCKLSSLDSYRIIREHIKRNINHDYAKITSDYDFCLTVVKRLELPEPFPYQVDVNAMYPRRKKKLVTRYNSHRDVVIYECAPRKDGKVYQKYSEAPCFEGKDQQDLENNIQQYLDDLMAHINEPLVSCKHCEGRGAIVKKFEK